MLSVHAMRFVGSAAPGDIAVVVVLLLCLAAGWWSGFVLQFIRLLGTLASVWVAVVYTPTVQRFLSHSAKLPATNLLTGLCVLGACLAVCHLTSFLLRRPINALRPEQPARFLGAFVGLLRGALLVGVIALLVLRCGNPGWRVRREAQRSVAASALARAADYTLQFLPGTSRSVLLKET